MRFRISIFSVFFCLIATFSLQAQFPEEMVVVGDSLSDSGNTLPVLDPLVIISSSPPTNGQTWPVHLAYRLGIENFTPSGEGGTSFAQSSAMTVDFNTLSNVDSILSQVKKVPSNISRDRSVFFIEGGANDFLNWPSLTGKESAHNYLQIIEAAKEKKFKTIIVSNLPDLGIDPFCVTIFGKSKSHVFSRQFNKTILNLLTEHQTHVLLINAYDFINEIIKTHPADYGFTNTTEKIPGLPHFGSPPAGYAFWYDGVHPTEAVYRHLADYIFGILKAPECVGTLAEVPFSIFTQQTTAINQQLFPLQPRHEKHRLTSFISGNYSPLLKHDTFSKGQEKAWGGNVSLGFTDRIADCWTLGIAGSYTVDHDKCHRCSRDFSFDLKTAGITAFTGLDPAWGYLNAIGSFSWLNFSDISRNFNIGRVHQHTHAQTQGHLYGAELNGGLFVYQSCQNCTNNSFFTGPTAVFEYEQVKIEGYREKGARIGNLVYRNQSNQFLIGGLGWEVNWLIYPSCSNKICNYGFNASLCANRQWLKNSREIFFRERSLPGVWGTWPYQNHRITFASGSLYFNVEFSNHIVLNMGYLGNIGSFGMSEHFFNLSLSYPIW